MKRLMTILRRRGKSRRRRWKRRRKGGGNNYEEKEEEAQIMKINHDKDNTNNIRFVRRCIYKRSS